MGRLWNPEASRRLAAVRLALPGRRAGHSPALVRGYSDILIQLGVEGLDSARIAI